MSRDSCPGLIPRGPDLHQRIVDTGLCSPDDSRRTLVGAAREERERWVDDQVLEEWGSR